MPSFSKGVHKYYFVCGFNSWSTFLSFRIVVIKCCFDLGHNLFSVLLAFRKDLMTMLAFPLNLFQDQITVTRVVHYYFYFDFSSISDLAYTHLF